MTRLLFSRIRALVALLALCLSTVAEPIEIVVDFARPAGAIRALHGINKGPLVAGGMLDLSEPLTALGLPLVRLHDCHWPNPDVVDMHAVFPRPEADPALEGSYDFVATDAYLAATRAMGARVVYRLGESIEHTTPRRFVHPPRDVAKWAQICAGIVRHYHEGWAGGVREGVAYWEVWNEPENRPAMWSGTDEDYLTLYQTTARVLRGRWPALKVGGPSVGALGDFVGGEFRATPFVLAFLERCRREKLPLDFFSWHSYTDDPAELVARAKAVRALLDAHGFNDCESHLNEWNYLPGRSWSPLTKKATPTQRQRAFEEMSGAAGAAFIASALLELQDAPVDAGNFFHGEAGGFGLFTEHGVPTKAYGAMRVFRRLLETPRRVLVEGATSGKLSIAAGLNDARTVAVILFSNFADPRIAVRLNCRNLPWSGATALEWRRIDLQRDEAATIQEIRNLTANSLTFDLPAPSVLSLNLRPAAER